MGLRGAGSRSPGDSLSARTSNKLHRQSLYVQHKKDKEKQKREQKFRRKKEEDRDPSLRRERIEKNQPLTLDKKRVFDDVDDDNLTSSVDFEKLRKRRKLALVNAQPLLEAELEIPNNEASGRAADGDKEGGKCQGSNVATADAHSAEQEAEDSIFEDSDSAGDKDDTMSSQVPAKQALRDDSMAPSTTSANLDLAPEALVAKFPVLFVDPPPMPKVLMTTCLNSTLHDEARLLCTLFPNSNYIPRSAHRYGHKYSVREISKFAANRGYTVLMCLREDYKRPVGLDIIRLPAGPTFSFSISNWMEGKKLPGHGNPTNHYPELLINNFVTPLGFLTAQLFRTLFPPDPEIQGRQVVTLHNQRDYIFVRRHRYVFREKRPTEKSVVGADGKELKGVEGIRAGLQELGPRFTLKLRRMYKGIGRAGSEGDDGIPWEWKAKMEKVRTRFNL